MARFNFTGSVLTLAEIAVLHPTIDHFHGTELVECHDGTRECVWHYGVWHEGGTVEVLDEHGNDAADLKGTDFNSLVGDEWHER